MKDFAPPEFDYPSTRYQGSKRRLAAWIWEHIKDLQFESVLDVFGGTGSISLLFKRYGKRVLYNDLLKFNQIIGKALIENESIILTEDEINRVLKFSARRYPDFIQTHFAGIFFLDKENEWLDKIVTNINMTKDGVKRSILMAALFQACLAKRPFNLFHRANLYLRTAKVKRTFGNKTTWERPFDELFRKYAHEYNNAIFSNGKRNQVIGGFDALSVPNGVDMVYLDPPYFSRNSSQGTNYLAFYHFLEGLADYEEWASRTDLRGKAKIIPESKYILNFTRRSEIENSFSNLLARFQKNIIVLSYRSDGIPSKTQISNLLRNLGKEISVFEKPHQYALSSGSRKELLFIAK